VAKGTNSGLPDLLIRYNHRIQEELFLSGQNHSRDLKGPFLYHIGSADENWNLLSNPNHSGKALRSALCLYAFHALNDYWEKALPAAIAIELLHNFSLIHDDIQDHDTERRHRRTLWTIIGEPKALLTGSAMHSIAYLNLFYLKDRGINEEKVLLASQLLFKTSLDMIKGQVLDLKFEQSIQINRNQYLEMIDFKTSSLISCSLAVGALLGTDHKPIIKAFAQYGLHLGRVFQLKDDILGIWGQSRVTGKSESNDILRKKKSFPIICALEACTPKDRKVLSKIYEKQTLGQQDLDVVMEVLEANQSKGKTEEFIEFEALSAIEQLNLIHIDGWALKDGKDLVDFLVNRDY
jgi:geranylgeranyl diphosphate synthase type I